MNRLPKKYIQNVTAITSHEKNTNRNYTAVPSQPISEVCHQDSKKKPTTVVRVCVCVCRNVTLISSWWECKLIQSLYDISMEAPQRIKTWDNTGSNYTTLVQIPKNQRHYREACMLMLTGALLQQPEDRSILGTHHRRRTRQRKEMWSVYTTGSLIHNKKAITLFVGKWMEQDSHRQRLCVFSHMYNLENMKLQRGRGLLGLWRAEGARKAKWALNMHQAH